MFPKASRGTFASLEGEACGAARNLRLGVTPALPSPGLHHPAHPPRHCRVHPPQDHRYRRRPPNRKTHKNRSSHTPSDSFGSNPGPSHNNSRSSTATPLNATPTSNPALVPEKNPRSASTAAKSRLTPRSVSDHSHVSGTVGSASAVLKVIDAGLLRKALKIQGGTAVKAQNICTFPLCWPKSDSDRYSTCPSSILAE